MRALATLFGALVLVAALGPGEAPAATAAHQVHLRGNVRPQRQAHRRRRRPVAHAAIIGGTLAEDDTFPWLAFIVYDGESLITCTGTVVAPNVVLTAGHCGEDTETGELREPSGYSVVTGNVEWTASPRQISDVSRVVVYPDFNPDYLTGDAALLVLSTPTTAPAIALASFPSDSARLEAGTPALIAGWGRTFPDELRQPERLSLAATVVQRSSYCESNASPFYEGYELCTIDPPDDETGACFGDSGGPLIALNPSATADMELGITSHVYGECSTDLPSVFTRADLIAPWVNEWIAAVTPPPPPAPAPAPTAAPAPAPAAAAPAPTTPAPPPPAFVPPNTPGYYVTRPSKTRKIVIHVSGDGKHVVGLSIKMPVPCRHEYFLPLDESALSYADNIVITNHSASTKLEVPPDRESKRGAIGVSLDFTASGVLEGSVHIHIPYRRRAVGLCAGTLKFTARM